MFSITMRPARLNRFVSAGIRFNATRLRCFYKRGGRSNASSCNSVPTDNKDLTLQLTNFVSLIPTIDV